MRNDDLNEITTAIAEDARSAATVAQSATLRAVNAGRLLAEAKKLLPRGEWVRWLARQDGLSVRSAQACLRLHKALQSMPADDARRVAQLPLRQALKAIASARNE